MSSPSLNIAAIQQEIEGGYISAQRHPDAPLRILNYTSRTQHQWRWNPETTKCRGLIVDEDWQVVQRPFEKFFGLEQLREMGRTIPSEPFESYEKLDGSLGILYHIDSHAAIALRGSFTSRGAQRATAIYRKKYGHIKVDKSLTYLFEIIDPTHRIVVDYGQQEDLILLAVIETSTGKEISPLPDIGFPVVKQYHGFKQVEDLVASEEPNREGYVLRFSSGMRVKIKFEEYKRIHRLVTGLTAKAVWDLLREGKDSSDVIGNLIVPNDFLDWVTKIESDLRQAFNSIESYCKTNLEVLQQQAPDNESRKELAARIWQTAYPSVVFAMLDQKNYSDKVWGLIRPQHSRQVFRRGGE